MDECECVGKATRIDKIRSKYYNLKSALYMKWHAFYWRALYITRLARPYSVAMCRLNLYRKFPGGRCMWCGEKH